MSEVRTQIVAEALTWLKTPFHHMGRQKGAGVDCAQFLCAAFEAVGLVPHINLGYYPHDWHKHQDRPRFLEILAQYADPIEGPALPGDVAMFKFGRHAAHGSIVVEWPLIVHAYSDERMVTLSDAATSSVLAERFAGFWRLRALAEA